MTINGRAYASGDDIPGTMVYPFFLMHMHVFGVSVGLYLLAHLLEG
jgi:hypothetical protein